MRQLGMYGHLLRSVSLTQSEFLHPQTLNPFARHCPNLGSLSIFSCSAISDEMFMGEVPELQPQPFQRLEVSHYVSLKSTLITFNP